MTRLILFILLIPSFSIADTFSDIETRFNLPTGLLKQIRSIESNSRSNQLRLNKNNTVDIGMFQINSVHWQTTCKELKLYNDYDNAICAALILSNIKKRYEKTDSMWMARYHSNTYKYKLRYYKQLTKGIK